MGFQRTSLRSELTLPMLSFFLLLVASWAVVARFPVRSSISSPSGVIVETRFGVPWETDQEGGFAWLTSPTAHLILANQEDSSVFGELTIGFMGNPCAHTVAVTIQDVGRTFVREVSQPAIEETLSLDLTLGPLDRRKITLTFTGILCRLSETDNREVYVRTQEPMFIKKSVSEENQEP